MRTAAGVLVTLLVFSLGAAFGQTPPVQAPATAAAVALHTEAVRVAAPPKLADYLDAGSHPGQRITGFKQRQPRDLEPATEATTVYLSYDESTFYAAFVCQVANPASIRARLAKREDVFNDDFVAIFFDTFRDKQRAYEFFTTPRGVQADGIVTLNDDMSFDAEWQSSAELTPTGYVAMFAIPFKVLRFPPPTDGAQHWGLALMRHVPAHDENDFWPAITNRVNGFATQFGVLDGMSGAAPGRNVQVIPYGTFTGARFLDDTAGGYATKTEGRVGMDTKFVVHDALTFDLTVNPDFSQVESDDPQVTTNQRFEVFFPEKRPFFLENSDIFNDTQQTLFFSRRVGDPQFGARMTGKVGQWALGGIAIDDRQPGAAADPGTPGSGDRAFAAIGRARYDFKNESRLGFFATARTFGPSSNTVGAVDTRLEVRPAVELRRANGHRHGDRCVGRVYARGVDARDPHARRPGVFSAVPIQRHVAELSDRAGLLAARRLSPGDELPAVAQISEARPRDRFRAELVRADHDRFGPGVSPIGSCAFRSSSICAATPSSSGATHSSPRRSAACG